ncbi:MAG: sialate O-acetylesterase [Candidatus Zipacnadales bacterium]
MRQFYRITLMMTAAVIVIGNCTPLYAEVRLPHIFSHHMVLQRDMELPVWGWAEPGEEVQVKLAERPAVRTTAGEDGRWSVLLPPMEAGGPVTLTVTGRNTLTVEDILVGEVWLCSGQSNMEWPVSASENAEQEVAAANYPQIRHIKIPRVPASFPQEDFEATWQVCSPETAGSFTAVGYFFGRYLHQELKVPIGLVNSSWGGTRIEPWIPPRGFTGIEALQDLDRQLTLKDPRSAEYKQALADYLAQTEAWLAKARTALEQEAPLEPLAPYPEALKPFTEHQQPTTLYNGMIYPLVPYALRGAIWYQGESNHGEGMLYTEKMRALINGWRAVWQQPDMPFYYVQIAPYLYGAEDPYVLPQFWEAQAAALAIPHTGMAVIHDIGNLNDIHPRNKQEVGKRLALIALAKTYGQEKLVYSGPTFRELKLEGTRLRVYFDHVGGGLKSRDGAPLNWFEIIGRETDFCPAEAVIEGDSVVLSSPEVPDPVAVQFAWHKTATPNLMNAEGLPAVPFRAGEVPRRDFLKLRVKEAENYQLVLDLDLAKLGPDITYDVDNRAQVTGSFDRIAYFLELEKPGEPTRYVYVSMDAFTDDLGKVGVPTVASGAVFQTKVTNLNVVSNMPGIVTGENLTGGNIEFWPHNYGPANKAGVPKASGSLWDFGDQYSEPVDGYGSMQVHNHEAGQTLFAINHWKAGAKADIGIGNSDGDTRDWTFKANASEYTVKRLRVLVRPK